MNSKSARKAQTLNEEQLFELLYLTEMKRRDNARESLLDFTAYTKADYEAAWFHQIICQTLELFVLRQLKRVMIFMPPRHGKSELVSRRLPAYIFGKFPTASIISCSYGADLASRMNRDVQRIIDHPLYREIFPDVALFGKNIRSTSEGSWLRNSEIFEIVNHGGTYRSAGVGGAITGMGADYGIIDDPIKNQEEALSPVYRQKVWDWFTSTFYTRLEKNGCVLLTVTRWHEDDLAGRILKNMPGQWHVLKFPALAEEERHPKDLRQIDEPLWSNKYDANALAEIRKAVGSQVWNALYQQRPSASKGNLIKPAWFKYYRMPPSHFDQKIMKWDMSFKGGSKSDFVVGTLWGKNGSNKYLLDMIRARMDFPETINAFKAFCAKHPDAHAKLVEDKANGPAVIASLKNEIPGIIPFDPKGSKESRVSAISAQIEAGNVYLCDPTVATYDVGAVLEEAGQFPKGQNDDIVDCISGALLYWAEKNTGTWGPPEDDYEPTIMGNLGDY